ncbi:hypothetical protein MCEMSEM29_01095 [Methylophilaceae bacterium]
MNLRNGCMLQGGEFKSVTLCLTRADQTKTTHNREMTIGILNG